EVQVAEEEMILAQELEVARDRLLDLDDQLADFVELLRVRHDLDADAGVVLVGKAALLAGSGLDVDLVAAAHEIGAGGRNERDATFQRLGFRRYTDTHLDNPQ